MRHAIAPYVEGTAHLTHVGADARRCRGAGSSLVLETHCARSPLAHGPPAPSMAVSRPMLLTAPNSTETPPVMGG